ncbi:MAG: hypothetical protein C0394_09300 [Syntrophus sp. (in: bacteria)]|nr:hypothetical protein [Syntrophus sp. (in: bacteria)]
MSGLRQMNINFDPIEDRLLLRITAGEPGSLDEYRIWLTRRFVRVIWKLLDQSITAETMNETTVPQESAGALQEFKEAAALAEADFHTPFAGAPNRTPLGPNPLLVSKIQIRRQPGGHLLTMETAQGQIINLALHSGLVHSFRKLLADQTQNAQWDLSLGMTTGKTAFLVEAPRTIN